jgi:hypothetical protein
MPDEAFQTMREGHLQAIQVMNEFIEIQKNYESVLRSCVQTENILAARQYALNTKKVTVWARIRASLPATEKRLTNDEREQRILEDPEVDALINEVNQLQRQHRTEAAEVDIVEMHYKTAYNRTQLLTAFPQLPS